MHVSLQIILSDRGWYSQSWINFSQSALQHHESIAINHGIKKNYFDSNMIKKGNATLLQRFPKDYLQRTSTEVNIYMRRHQTRSFVRTTLVTWFITNFHTVTFPTGFSEKNVNVMLEFLIVGDGIGTVCINSIMHSRKKEIENAVCSFRDLSKLHHLLSIPVQYHVGYFPNFQYSFFLRSSVLQSAFSHELLHLPSH